MSSVEHTLKERGSRYGDFTDHATICQNVKSAMLHKTNWNRLSDVQKQALEVIADKIARILSGDPNYADNWHDIQGYAKLVEERLPKPERCDVGSTGPGPEPAPTDEKSDRRMTGEVNTGHEAGQFHGTLNLGPRRDTIENLFKSILGILPTSMGQPKPDPLADLPGEIVDTVMALRAMGIHLKEITVLDHVNKGTKTYKLD